MLNLESLFEEARQEVLSRENEWLQGWSEIRAGHKTAVKSFINLFKSGKISSEEVRNLIGFATEMALKDSTPQELFKSGSIDEATYRMLTSQYGSFEPLE